MGSPLSPIITDLTLQNFESHIPKNLSFIPSFYIRYVDDIALAALHTLLSELLEKFNSFHPRLKIHHRNWRYLTQFPRINLYK